MSSDFDISKGKYWQQGLQLVDGCTPCSPGCNHCWSAAMTRRFDREHRFRELNTPDGKFNGTIVIHPERLSIPLRRKKPTVYAIWNDWAHEEVDPDFRRQMIRVAVDCPQHTFLALTKRPHNAGAFFDWMKIIDNDFLFPDNWWTGVTVCNQQEADEQIPVFLQIPGNRWLSIEPLLSAVYITPFLRCPFCGYTRQDQLIHQDHHLCRFGKIPEIRCVILGGETGPGARPMHPDWVRSVRDQCAAAGVSFFFKSWGKHIPVEQKSISQINANRFLDGRTHDELPWLRGV